MNQTESDYREILLNYRDYYGTYHHHKEMMAWLATALYISFVTFLLGSDIDMLKMRYSSCIAIIIFLLITAIVIFFIGWQFSNRAFASRLVSGCTILLTCKLNGCELKKDSLQPYTFKKNNRDRWPKILVETSERDQNGHSTSEIFTYIMIAIFCAIGVAHFVLISPCKGS